MNISRSILTLICLITIQCLYAQVNVIEDEEVSKMLSSFQTTEKAETHMEGYRIQIITTPDRRKMESTRAKFKAMYPDVYMEWEHVSPYYQVRIGAYETKMDLMKFMIELKQDYRDAIPVVSDIKKSELITY